MGKVVVAAKIENLNDLVQVQYGGADPATVRVVEVDDALVDMGATGLMVPSRLISQLGLTQFRTRRARTVGGPITLGVYRAVQLTVQGRDCICDVHEVSDELPVLIGQIPLETLDFVVDPVNHRLAGNPDHNGEHMVDAF